MRSPRSSARINLRFRDLHEMDKIELRANEQGLDLQNWLRQLVRQEMKDQQFRRHLAKTAIKILIKIYYLLEALVDSKIVATAEEKAEQEMLRIQSQSDDF